MGGLVEQASSPASDLAAELARAHSAWEASMLASLDRLRPMLQARPASHLAELAGGDWSESRIDLVYWGRPVAISFPALEACYPDDGRALPTFDLAMLLFYLHTADGAPPAGRWVGYRDLPGGLFYNQAFQGYTGDRIAAAFGANPDSFGPAAVATEGTRIQDLASLAFAFHPLPMIRLAAVLWLGDDELACKASVLFDAAAPHYLPTDGLALLGAGLTGRLLKARPQPAA